MSAPLPTLKEAEAAAKNLDSIANRIAFDMVQKLGYIKTKQQEDSVIFRMEEQMKVQGMQEYVIPCQSDCPDFNRVWNEVYPYYHTMLKNAVNKMRSLMAN